METIKIKKFVEIENVAEKLKNSDVLVDFSNCEDMRERSRMIDFLAGLVYYTGSIKKKDKDTFLVSLNNT